MVMLFEGYGHGLRLCVCSLGFYWAIKIKDEKVALQKTANVVICYKHTNIDSSLMSSFRQLKGLLAIW